MHIHITNKGRKLLTLCQREGFQKVEELLEAKGFDSVMPGICLTEGCDYTAEVEGDQEEGYCEACGGNTVTSVLVLAGVI